MYSCQVAVGLSSGFSGDCTTVAFVICVNYIFLTGHERVGHKSLIIPLNMTDHWVVVESEHHKSDNHGG